MAIRNIVLEGDPILKRKARPVGEITDRIKQLAEDMMETMHLHNGIGIAAPQVGVGRSLCIVGIGIDEPENTTFLTMVDPEILETEGSQWDYEGCLSVPGYLGKVNRPERVKVRYKDLSGQIHERDFKGFDAVVVSHETDHLKGEMYTDKASCMIPWGEDDEEELI